MDVLLLASKALASCHVCVRAVVELQSWVQINGGSQQAQPFSSSSGQLCNRKKKKIKKKKKKERRARVETNPSGAVFHLPFNILQSKVSCVCVSVCVLHIINKLHHHSTVNKRKQFLINYVFLRATLRQFEEIYSWITALSICFHTDNRSICSHR